MNTTTATNRLADIAARNSRGQLNDVLFAVMVMLLMTIFIGGI
jgi:hypothetical protein